MTAEQIENPRDRADRCLAEVINRLSGSDPERMRIAVLIGKARRAAAEIGATDALVRIRAARQFEDLSKRGERKQLQRECEKAREFLEESET